MNKRLIVPVEFVHPSPCPGIFAGYVKVDGLGAFLVERDGDKYIAIIPEPLYERAVKAFGLVKDEGTSL